jgi:hypothetical protein
LTRALKSYHLNKARSASELPPWLFSEEERRVSKSGFSSSHREDTETSEHVPRPFKRNGLKAIYADINAETSMSDNAPRYQNERRPVQAAHSRFDDPELRYDLSATDGHQSKATSRLQAMRDARRPTVRNPQESVVGHAVDPNRDFSREVMREREEMPTRRVGLPMGPKQRRN